MSLDSSRLHSIIHNFVYSHFKSILLVGGPKVTKKLPVILLRVFFHKDARGINVIMRVIITAQEVFPTVQSLKSHT